jgi:hypothetical protein
VAHDIGLADILRSCYPSTFKVSVAQAKAWRAIVACRTEALGGHVECCDHCGALRHVYHSCRNRHCPQCQTRAKEAWLAARRSGLLPVPYFHLVFTLPHDLNGLAGCDPRTLYELLFGAVSDTLTAFAANPRWLGGTPSFTLVLHTWKQDLGRHIHVHALVAGGALTADKQWISPKRRFLLHVLPGGFKRIRHYGLLGPAHKTANLAAARQALAVPVPDPTVVESVAAFMQRVAGIEWMDCPHCRNGHFVVILAVPPSFMTKPESTKLFACSL